MYVVYVGKIGTVDFGSRSRPGWKLLIKLNAPILYRLSSCSLINFNTFQVMYGILNVLATDALVDYLSFDVA